MKTAIFLGAGASKADGAPLQNELFQEYFLEINERSNNRPCFKTKVPKADDPHPQLNKLPQSISEIESNIKICNSDMELEMGTFFENLFYIDFQIDIKEINFPTFEEVLGVIDLAIIRGETLLGYNLDNININSNRIRKMRTYLILSIVDILKIKLHNSKGLHKKLVDSLKEINKINDVVFLSTNYDILIDNALMKLQNNPTALDYGVNFANFTRDDDWKRPVSSSYKLYKLHGSFNWLYCSTCNNLTLTPNEKGISRLIDDIGRAICPGCKSLYSPILVPPTFFKNMDNVFLHQIWNKAEQDLREVEHIIFCGYSFPDADIHIKYLLKRIQTNRQEKNLKFTVINYFQDKEKYICDEEENRFKRFLGENVNYTYNSFEEFCNDPTMYIK